MFLSTCVTRTSWKRTCAASAQALRHVASSVGAVMGLSACPVNRDSEELGGILEALQVPSATGSPLGHVHQPGTRSAAPATSSSRLGLWELAELQPSAAAAYNTQLGRAGRALAPCRGLPGGDEVPLELLALRLVRRASRRRFPLDARARALVLLRRRRLCRLEPPLQLQPGGRVAGGHGVPLLELQPPGALELFLSRRRCPRRLEESSTTSRSRGTRTTSSPSVKWCRSVR